MLLETLLSQISGVEIQGDPKTPIEGIAYDSRKVSPGDLFVAVRGQRTNGVLYVSDAIRRGAAAIAAENAYHPESGVPRLVVEDARRFLAEAARVFWGDPSQSLKLVAVTGTNGKTTTTCLVQAILRHAGHRTIASGTLGVEIDGRHVASERTTPEATDLTRVLHQAILSGCTHGALEVSSHALALKRVYGMKFAVAVFTNLTRDHLDFHGDMESYFRAKSLLFSAAGANHIEAAVINADDPYAMRLAGGLACPFVTYGTSEKSDIRLLESALLTEGTTMALATPAGRMDVTLRLPGRPNIYNAMAATGSALALGIRAEDILRGLGSVEDVPGRMELVRAGQPFSVIVDYAHTPDALEKLLETVRALPHRRVITVFGCGGDRDRTKRPLMGAVAVRMSDHVIATSDNPRSEDPLVILDEIRVGLQERTGAYEIVPDRGEAIGRAISLARPGDAVIIAGKGHEAYQLVGDRVLPFDDRVVAREWIGRLRDRRRDRGTAKVL
ncbi:MAG: UDP-N-acetylmuramoyl-L-alanyl-D-glutamate--2,6-diaminopimelate ligase [Acidobacteria bacterium]|nr:UDP-N-acetylmuramoyl-L-alanyl-D-glutamate--2,6-diaminopimelate ligase [Acidobacteriota bacterium]